MAIEFYKLRLSVGKKYREGLISKEMYEGCIDAIDVTEQISTGEFFYGCELGGYRDLSDLKFKEVQ